jgi:hypothetical protein
MELKMNAFVKKLCTLLLSISVILIPLNFYRPTWAQGVALNSQKDNTTYIGSGRQTLVNVYMGLWNIHSSDSVVCALSKT